MNVNLMTKGVAKAALGVSVLGMTYYLKKMQVFPEDTMGQATKYAGYAAGILYMLRGGSSMLNGGY